MKFRRERQGCQLRYGDDPDGTAGEQPAGRHNLGVERVVVTGETGEWSGDELVCLSILVVFLCLAALYESWSVPISVILVIPLGVLGAALAASLRGLSNDVYFQVALLTTIGLSSKNAILIVEFAEAKSRKVTP